MALTIHEYALKLTNEQEIRVPSTFRPLSVQVQLGELCLWAMVDPDAEIRPVTICIIGTNRKLEHVSPEFYIGTVQDCHLAWHVFYKP